MVLKTLAAGCFALVACSPAAASDCFAPLDSIGPGFNVVAPEMSASLPANPYCMSVDLALASLRARAAAGAYVPLTKDDNTPWRFDMSQNGKRMTVEEFSAWMTAKGIRVATGKPPAAELPLPPPPPVEAGK